MTPSTPPNVKIYDRPARKGPSPLLLVIALVVLIAIGFFVYRALHHAAPPPARAQTGRAFPVTGGAWRAPARLYRLAA